MLMRFDYKALYMDKILKSICDVSIFVMLAFFTCVGVAHAIRVGPIDVELIDSSQYQLPTYQYQGEEYVLGRDHQRYQIRVRNHSDERYEVVITVDGRDVVNGQPGAFRHRGYVVDPYQSFEIEGFRSSSSEVATFRFTSPGDSYAGRMGTGQNVGIIGIAVFNERERHRDAPRPRPYPHRHHERESAASLDDNFDGKASAPRSGAQLQERSASGLSGSGLSRSSRKQSRSELGTQYGERRYSEVEETRFIRASSQPSSQRVIYYDNERGLRRRGVIRDDHVSTHPQAFPDERRYAPPPPG